jgi:hypothetical protein
MKYIIDFKNSTSTDDISNYLSNLSPISTQNMSQFEKTYIVETTATPAVTDIIENIVDDSSAPISLLSFTQEFTDNLNDPTTDININDDDNWWKVASIRYPDYTEDVNSHAVRGKNVNVYIVDSGLEADHAEFADATIRNIFSITGEFGDTRGHGTALASLISGKTCGLTNATLCVVKVFEAGMSTYQSDLVRALDAILDDYKANGSKMSVINMSWSISKNSFIESKLQKLLDEGMFVVCSAGNSGTAIENVTPASMISVTTVGSYNSDLVPSDFSNYTGPQPISLTAEPVNHGELDGWAPGENIKVALLNGQYGHANGTSLAAAIHSGSLAYNAIDQLIDNDVLPQGCMEVDTNRNIWSQRWSFGRTNILTLSGVYVDSKNTITTYRTLTGPDQQDSGIAVKVKSGGTVCQKLFRNIKKVTILNADSLPSGLRFEGSYILGTAPEISDNAEVHDLDLEITSITDVVSSYKLGIHILNKNIVESDIVPGEDIVLDFILAAAQCCGPSAMVSFCQSTTSMCSVFPCGFSGVCNFVSKGNCQCLGC